MKDRYSLNFAILDDEVVKVASELLRKCKEKESSKGIHNGPT